MAERSFKITVLVEDSTTRRELVPEHGFSLLVESGGISGLFDTGQTYGVILGNAQNSGVDLKVLSWIVLSHGHYDHTGGLKAVLDVARNATVFAHPEVFAAKYVKETRGRWRPAGVPISRGEAEQAGAKLEFTAEQTEVAPGIMTTGRIPRTTEFEPVGDNFFVEKERRKVPDEFVDDQALILQRQKDLVVLLGCAHSGVVNTLRHVAEITGGQRIHAVLGGMHLGGASRERISGTIDAFREYEVEKIGLAHCTGRSAEKEFFTALGERCFLCPTGTVIEF